jgi:hypothetical protein
MFCKNVATMKFTTKMKLLKGKMSFLYYNYLFSTFTPLMANFNNLGIVSITKQGEEDWREFGQKL